MFCLPKEEVNKFIKALKEGVIKPEELASMSSEARRSFFTDIVGAKDAVEVNALFESKLLLKNQQAGMVRWAEQLTGITKDTRQGILDKINRLEKVLSAEDQASFLEDLAAKRLGTEVTFEQSQKIIELAKDAETKKGEWNPQTQEWSDNPNWRKSEKRLEYGLSYYALKEYISDLRLKNTKNTYKDILKSDSGALQKLASMSGKTIMELAGTAKSILASLDNSFFGRQGIKTLFTAPDLWAKNFGKSWSDIGKELRGIDAVAPVKADIYSRPNAMNGNYAKSELAIGIRAEEAFPSSIPTKIPVLGRLFKSSESAYTAAGLRLRADLFDRTVSKAEKLGVDMSDPAQAKAMGKVINSLTGRGSIGKFEAIGTELNSLMFSPKFLKSQIDTLTAHAFDKGITKYARKQAVTNLVEIIGATAGILALAKFFDPDSTSFDPRSSKFGTIYGIDITGGVRSIAITASRIATKTYINQNGQERKLNTGKYGALTGLDMLYSFAEGKASPTARVLVDILKGENFEGEKPTAKSIILDNTIPLPIQTYEDLKDDPDMLIKMMFGQIGFSPTGTSKKK